MTERITEFWLSLPLVVRIILSPIAAFVMTLAMIAVFISLITWLPLVSLFMWIVTGREPE